MNNLVRDILQWDTGSWEVSLSFWSELLLKQGSNLNCLELGGREGGLSLWLAISGHSVVCSDLCDTSQSAGPLHEKHFVKNVRYEVIDATSIPYRNHFDVIVFKSILGGIGYNGNRQAMEKVFEEIHAALKPGGILLFAENARATALHAYLRRKFTRWGSNWFYVTIDDMKKFLTPFTSTGIKSTGFTALFGRSERQKIMLSKIDRLIFNKIVPSYWKYIIFGFAVK